MAIRIQRSTIFVTTTQDPNIIIVDADVTKDDETVTNPTFVHVSVPWNVNTTKAVLKDAIRQAIKDTALQDDLRAAIGEDIVIGGV